PSELANVRAVSQDDELQTLADNFSDRLRTGDGWPVVGAILAVLRNGSDVRQFAGDKLPLPLVQRFENVADNLLADDALYAICTRLRPAAGGANGSEPLDPELIM